MEYHATDEKILYVGRWAHEDGRGSWNKDPKMTAACAGSRFYFAYRGKLCRMKFDTNLNQGPMPHLWVRVDDGARVEVPLDRYLRVDASDDGVHRVEVILKGMVEMTPRWYPPLTNKITLECIETEELVALPKARQKQKTIEFVGDSITEGVLIDAECTYNANEVYNRPWQDDVTATYAWLTAENLGLCPLMMGYGAVGVTQGGCGGVPKAADAYPFCFDGEPVTYGHPDYVFINHGTNDWQADSVTFTAGYVALLDAIFTAHPKTQVIAMVPFKGAHREDIERLVREYNDRHNEHILYVDSSQWLPADAPVHPDRGGHRLAAECLTAVLKKELDL